MKPWELPKRLDEIKRVRNGRTEGTYPLIFRGGLEDFPIYKVPIGMPIYRLANGRTIARQKEYIARNNKPENFFMIDPESIEAIEAQDEILRDMVREEGLYEYFRSPTTVQDEPLVLDEYGYIINGNRRICAMRMLIQRNYELYNKYEYIRVIILDNYNEEDIIRLEAQLQIKRDIKADYSWITEALMYKNHMETQGYDYALLERLYETKQREIKNLIEMAEYADEYLLSREKKDEYSLVENHKEAFSQLRRFRKNFRDIQNQELFKELVFQFLDSPEDSPGRIYQTVKDIADHLPDIKKTIVEEFELPPQEEVKTESKQDYSILTSVVEQENENETVVNEEIIEFVKSGEEASEVREQVVNTIILGKKKNKEKRSKNAFRKNVQNAYTSLIDAKNLYNGDSNCDGVTKYIENIEGVLKEIKDFLK